jgi:simple sugar transport system permease protein
VPASIWLCLLLFAVGIVLLGFTRYGRALYAIGGNAAKAAKAASIRTDQVLWTALVGASLLAALGGLLVSGHLASVAAAQGDGAVIIVALVLSRLTGGKVQD